MIHNDEQRTYNSNLRCAVYLKFPDEIPSVDALVKLLGYKDFTDMQRNFTSEDINICRALAGPHGYTIYKMILAKRSLP